MAYSDELATRVRAALGGQTSVVEKKMFGGLTFMVDGHMCCGVVQEMLMVRVGPDGYDEALMEPHARPMDFTGKALTGMLYVEPQGLQPDEALGRWVKRGLAFVQSKPPK